MSAKYKSPSFLLPNELNTSANTANDTGVNSLYSIDFNQASGYVISNDALITGNQSRSISVWAKSFVDFAGANDNQVVFSLGTGSIGDKTKFAIKIRGSQRIQIDAKGYNVDFNSSYPGANWGSIDLNDHQWHHYVVTYATDDLKLYVDGTFIAGSTNYNSLVTQDGFLIGAWYRNGSFADYFLGEIDEVSVFNRVLNTTEIAALYDGTGSNKRPSNLMATNLNPVAYYPLGEQAQNSGYLGSSGNEWQFPNGVLQDYVMDFNGSSRFRSSSTLLSGADKFTISTWVNLPNQSSGYTSIYSLYNSNADRMFFQFNGLQLYARINSATYTINNGNGGWDVNSIINKWGNITVVYNGTLTGNNRFKVFINGVLNNSGTYSGTFPTSLAAWNDDLSIGASYSTPGGSPASNFLDGKLSNLAIWNTDQSASANIADIYNNGSPQTTYTVTPQNWWKLNADSVYTPSAPSYTTALDFTRSTDDHVEIPNSSSLNIEDSYTISLWANRNDLSQWSYLFDKGNTAGTILNWRILFNNSSYANQVQFQINGTSGAAANVYSGTTPAIGAWTHIVCIKDGSTMRMYINGQNTGNTATAPTGITNTDPAFIGTNHSGVYAAEGKISNVAIYNTALTATQVSTLFNFGTPQTAISFSPIGWWKLDNTTTGIQDSSGNGNNGTNNGATQVNTSVAVVPSWKIPTALTIPTINYTSSLFIDESAQDRIDLNCTISGSTITGDGINLATTNTIAFWLYNSPTEPSAGPILGGPHSTTSGNNFGTLIRASGGSSMASEKYGSIGYWLTGQQAFGSSALNATRNRQWQHLAFVRNGSTVTLYIDGQTGSASDYQITLSIPANETIVYNIGEGINHNSGSFHADAYISNLQLFSTNLPATGSESIESLYNNGQPKDITGFSNIAAWYTLTDTTTTSGGGLHDNGSSNFPANNSGASKVDGNVLVPSFNIPVNGVSTTLPSTALQQSDLQFDSPYSNYSLSFDGTSSINCGSSLNSSLNGFSNSFSVSLWVKVTNTSTRRGIIANYTQSSNVGFYIDILRVNDTTFTFQGGYHSSSSTYVLRASSSQFTTNNWYHVSMTVNAGGSNNSVNIYVDGVLNNGTSYFSQPVSYTNTNDLKIASVAYSGDEIIGEVDETAIFNYALSSAQILEIYNNGKPGNLSNYSGTAPISWWRLGENAYFVNNDITLPNSISGAPNGTGAGTVTSMLTADAPGTYANGIGTNLDIVDRVGDAPLSIANSQSYNIIPDDKVPYVPGYVGAQTTNASEMTFDGIDDYFDLGTYTQGTGLALNADMSISAWIKTSNLTSTQVVICNLNSGSSSGGYCIEMNRLANGQYGILYDSATVGLQGSTILSSNTWYHIVMTRTGTSGNWSYNLYLNGNADGSATNVAQNFGNGSVAIGRFGAYNGGYFNGQIDEVAIFDTALTADQVKFDLYKPSLPLGSSKTADLVNNPNLPTPVAWYRMGDPQP